MSPSSPRTVAVALLALGPVLAGAPPAWPAPLPASLAVGRPVLEVLGPEVDQAALRLTFRVRNRGQTDLPPSAITVRYRVEGVVRGPAELIAEGAFRADRVALPAGATASLGGVVLPDRRRAFSFPNLTVNVGLVVEAPLQVEPASASFPLRWRTRVAVIDAGALRRAGGASLRVRIDNFDPAAGARPPSSGSCLVAVACGARESALRFDLPAHPVSGPRGPVLVLVDGLESRAAQPTSVADGNLVLRVEVAPPTGDALKAGALVGGRFDDGAWPDAGLPPFPVTARLAVTVGRDRSRLSVAPAEVDVPVPAARLPAGLAPLRAAVEATAAEVRDAIVAHTKSLLSRPDARSAVEDLLLRAVEAAGPVSAIHAVEARGDSIVVTYL